MLENMYVKVHTHIYYIIYISPPRNQALVFESPAPSMYTSPFKQRFLTLVYSGKEALTGLSVACTAPFQRAEVTEATCDPTLPGPRMEGLGPPQECLWWLVLMPNCQRGPLATNCLGCCRNQAAKKQLL